MAMRYQVPQFVDIEDKIIGPLTLKQFLIYFSAVLVLIPIYLFTDLSLFITLALPVLAVAAGFAHFKPGGKPLAVFVANAAGFFTSSRWWLWRRQAKLHPLRVRGIELERAPYDFLPEETQPSLQHKMQTIETEGNVSQEDMADPLTEEEQVQSVPEGGKEA